MRLDAPRWSIVKWEENDLIGKSPEEYVFPAVSLCYRTVNYRVYKFAFPPINL